MPYGRNEPLPVIELAAAARTGAFDGDAAGVIAARGFHVPMMTEIDISLSPGVFRVRSRRHIS